MRAQWTVSRVTQPAYDELLTFEPHVSQLREKLQERAKVRGALGGASWGCSRETLRAVHMTYVQSKLEYGLPAFAPFVPPDRYAGLGTEQYFGAYHVSGCPRGTRREVAFAEAGLQPLSQRVEHSAAVLYERCRRLPEGNRARAVAETDPVLNSNTKQKALQRRSWREHATAIIASAGLADAEREPLLTHGAPPWRTWDFAEFHPYLARRVTRKDPEEVRRAAALDTIAQLAQGDVDAYTDVGMLRHVRSEENSQKLKDKQLEQYKVKV